MQFKSNHLKAIIMPNNESKKVITEVVQQKDLIKVSVAESATPQALKKSAAAQASLTTTSHVEAQATAARLEAAATLEAAKTETVSQTTISATEGGQ